MTRCCSILGRMSWCTEMWPKEIPAAFCCVQARHSMIISKRCYMLKIAVLLERPVLSCVQIRYHFVVPNCHSHAYCCSICVLRIPDDGYRDRRHKLCQATSLDEACGFDQMSTRPALWIRPTIPFALTPSTSLLLSYYQISILTLLYTPITVSNEARSYRDQAEEHHTSHKRQPSYSHRPIASPIP